MKDAEIRAQLEKELGEPFAEATWKRFRGSQCFEEYRDNKLEWLDLKELAEEEQGYAQELLLEAAPREKDFGYASGEPGRRKSSRPDPQDVVVEPPKLSEAEILRGEVFEECLTEVAAIDPRVREFQKKVLGDKPLEPGQARDLVRSPAAQALSLRLFEKWDIPMLDHHAELKNYEFNVPEDGRQRDRATIFVDPPGETKQVWSPPKKEQRRIMLDFINENGREERSAVWGTSLLGQLHQLSEHLAERFSWQKAQATDFVLTGSIPAVPPARIRYRLEEDEHFRRGEVILTLSPWLSGETVKKIYQSAQRRILLLDVSHSRQLETKNLKLLRFIIERTSFVELTRGERKKLGAHLAGAWDKENPHWAYGKDTVHFWRDYNETRGRVVNPEYSRPRELRTSSEWQQ